MFEFELLSINNRSANLVVGEKNTAKKKEAYRPVKDNTEQRDIRCTNFRDRAIPKGKARKTTRFDHREANDPRAERALIKHTQFENKKQEALRQLKIRQIERERDISRQKERSQHLQELEEKTVNILLEEEEKKEPTRNALRFKQNKIKKKQRKVESDQFRDMCKRNRELKREKKSKLSASKLEVNAESLRDGMFDALGLLNPLGDHPDLVDLIGPWINFSYLCYRSKNVFDIYSALYSLRVTGVRLNFDTLVTKYSEILLSWNSEIPTESISGNLEMAKSFFNGAVSSQVSLSLRNILLTVVSLKVFDSEITTDIISVFGKPQKMCFLELINFVSEQVINLVRFGENLVRGASWSELFTSKDPHQTALARGRELIYAADKVYTGLPVPGQMNIKDFILDADKVISILELYAKSVNVLSTRGNDTWNILNRLKELVYDARTKLNAATRITPFAVMLTGDPGIGKSTILNLIADVWEKVNGREFNETNIYHRNMVSTYWENYNPLSQNIIHYSELGNTDPKIMATRGDPAFQELTSVVDSLPFPCDMAFDGKGKTYALPELVIADSNSKLDNIGVMVTNKGAYLRRFLFIEPIVKPEFRLKGSTMLDSKKALSNDPMEVWTFRVWRHFTQSKDKTHVEHYMQGDEKDDTSALVSLLQGEFYNHLTVAGGVKSASSTMFDSSRYIDEERRFANPISNNTVHEFKAECMRSSPTVTSISNTVSNVLHSLITFLFLIVTYLLLYCGEVLIDYSLDFGMARRFARWSCSGMRIYTWRRIRVFCGYNANLLETNYFLLNGSKIVIAIAAIANAIAVYKLIFNRPKPHLVESEAISVFLDESDPLAKLERDSESRPQGKRVQVAGTKYWNNVLKEDPIGLHTGTLEELYHKYSRNTRAVSVISDSPTRTHIFGVCQDIALINTHAITPFPSEVRVYQTAGHGDMWHHYVSCKVTLDDTVVVSQDVSLIRLRGVVFRDVVKHLPQKTLQFKSYKGLFNDEEVYVKTIEGDIVLNDNGTKIPVRRVFSYAFPDHKAGECGKPLFIQSGTSFLAGVHAGGLDGTGYSVPVVQEDVCVALETLKLKQTFIPVNSLSSKPILNLEMPAKKSVFRHEHLPGIDLLGKIPGPIMLNNDSKLKRSPLYKQLGVALTKVGILQESEFTRPMMKPTMVYGEYVSPYNVAMRKISRHKPSLNTETMARVIDEIVSRALIFMPPLHPLTIDEAINGAELDPLIRRINVKTGAGSGFKGKKSNYLPVYSEEDSRLTRFPDSELREKVINIVENYTDGQMSNSIYTACLKDEPRSLEKAKSGETRMFFMSPLDLLLISRMYLGPFYSNLVAVPNMFCTAVGIDALSGFNKMIREMLDFSHLFLEFDYKGYDVGMPYDIGLAVNTIIYRVCKARGYNDHALLVLQGILSDSMHINVDVLTDLMTVPSLQPSGKYGTAEDNSLRGLVLLMYSYYTLAPQGWKRSFFDDVMPRLYGDDALAAIKPAVTSWFNNVEYQNFCKDYYNIVVTPAIKTDAMCPTLCVKEISFLKRKFVYDNEWNFFKAPLDSSSLHKMIQWYLPSSSIPTSEQLIQAAQACLWESVCHINEKEHDDLRHIFSNVISEHYGYCPELPIFSNVKGRILGDDTYMAVSEEDNCPVDVILPPVLVIGAESYCYSRMGCVETHLTPHKITNCRVLQKACTGQITLCENKEIHNYMPISEQIHYYETQVIALEKELLQYPEYAPLSSRLLHKRKASSGWTERLRIKHYTHLRSRLEDINLTIKCLKNIERTNFEINAESDKMENLQDIPGDGVDVKSAGISDYTDEGQRNVLSMSDFLSRPVKIYEGSLALSTDIGLQLSVWDLFSLQPSVRAKMRNFAYLKGNLHLRITISGSPFHYGRILLSYQPYAAYNETITNHLTSLSATGWRPLFFKLPLSG